MNRKVVNQVNSLECNMYGLVLEGGGGKGSYQIGACKALAELGIEFSAVAGTSIGALNGAMVVQDDIERAYDLWYDINPYSIINLAEEELISFNEAGSMGDSFNLIIRKLKKVIAERGLDISPLVKTVKDVIDEDRIRDSPIDFGIVTVDLTGRKALEIFKEDIPKGKLADYIIASASFPAFRPAVIDGRTFIDGGFYNTLPINMVRSKGCSNIIVLRTFGLGIKKRIDTSELNIINIAPSEGLGPMLDFNYERARKNLKMGYFDVLKVFKQLKGKKYYITPLNDDSFFIKYLSGISEKKVQSLCELFGFEKCLNRRALFEFLIPKIADLLNLHSYSSYEDIALELLEKIADVSGVERFKIYTVDEFYSKIAAGYKYKNDDFVKEIPGFMKSREMITRFMREKIIDSIANELFGCDNIA